MKKFTKVLALVFALAILLTACQGATTTTDEVSDFAYVQEKDELIIGMTLFAPMNYYEGEELVGFETEFAKVVAEKLGVEAKFVEIDWNTKEVELAAKSIDCIWNGMTITPERSEAMSISTPYMANKQVMVAKAENAEAYTTADALEGIVLVAEAESAGESVAMEDEFFSKASYTAVDSQAKALMEVSSGTAGACVVDYVASIGMIGEGTDYEDLVVVATEEFSPEQYGIAFRKGSDITEKVNVAIAELAEDGTLEAIAKKYKLVDLLEF
ncbi:MAG: transporter substrate-binding domain-containing protein [Ruminococcaceae bacterium]|nr:transporter substrate-binding domain-containing protein [Oscillospiraceae bacterium]